MAIQSLANFNSTPIFLFSLLFQLPLYDNDMKIDRHCEKFSNNIVYISSVFPCSNIAIENFHNFILLWNEFFFSIMHFISTIIFIFQDDINLLSRTEYKFSYRKLPHFTNDENNFFFCYYFVMVKFLLFSIHRLKIFCLSNNNDCRLEFI